MNKKKKILLGSTLSILSLGLVFGVATKANGLFTTFGAAGDTWVHYDEKKATLDRRGCKEYWVNCSTHEHVFTAPSVEPEKIVDGGVLKDDLLYALATNDDRVVMPTYDDLYLDFEDEADLDYVSSIRNNFKTKEIVTGGVSGKCMQVTYKDGTADFVLSDEYLEKAFADEAVTGIAFDIKSSTKFDVQRFNGSGQVRYVGNGDGQYQCRTDYFKTYVWTRTVYNDYLSKKATTPRAKAMLWVVVTPDTQTVCLDNIHPVTDYNMETVGEFDGPDIVDSSANVSFRINSAEQIVFQGGSSFEISGEYSTTGTKSFKIRCTSGSTAKLIINPNYRSKMSAGDMLSFDVMIKAVEPANFGGYNSSNIQCSGQSLNRGGFLVNKWHTIQVPKSRLDTAIEAFWCGVGNRTVDFYFDNVRIIKAGHADTGFSFEENGAREVTANKEYVFNANWDSTNTAYAEIKALSTDNAAILNFKATAGFASEGTHSLMITKKNGYIAFFLSAEYKAALETAGKKLSFDMYTTMPLTTAASTGQLMTGMNGAMPHAHTAAQWNTYTLSLSDMTSDARFLIVAGSTAGDVYLDNFRMVD